MKEGRRKRGERRGKREEKTRERERRKEGIERGGRKGKRDEKGLSPLIIWCPKMTQFCQFYSLTFIS